MAPSQISIGDQVLVSGPVGRHGMAVMSQRDGVEFDSEIVSDVGPLHRLVADLLADGVEVHAARDLTRGGLAAAMCELADPQRHGIALVEADVLVPRDVAAACGFLGIDPWHVANEGTMAVIVAGTDGARAADVMRRRPEGTDAAQVGVVTGEHRGHVVALTSLGTRRVVDPPMGEQLPRIC